MTKWDRLVMRLKSIADNKGRCGGVSSIIVTLFFKDGELVGWYRPYRTTVEPVESFPVECLPLEGKNDG